MDVIGTNPVEYIYYHNVDSHGLVVQANGDRGDSCSRTNIFYYLRKLNEGENPQRDEAYSKAVAKYEVSKDTYVRHPDGTTPYPNGMIPQDYIANPERLSRDQQTPLIIALGAHPNERARLTGLFKAHLKRFGRYQNKDFMGPQHLGMYIRSLTQHYIWMNILHPILTILDIGLVIDSYINVYRRNKNPDDTSDSVNHTLALIQSHHVNPTFLSRFAIKVFKKSNPQQALDSYFKLESSAPPLNQLYAVQTKLIGLQ